MLYETWFTKWLDKNQEFYASIGLDVIQRMALSKVYRAAFDKDMDSQEIQSDGKDNFKIKLVED